MGPLDGVTWEGKVLKGGAWVDGGGGTFAVVEPATGNELGTACGQPPSWWRSWPRPSGS
jgi:hypothetical protein